MGYINVGNLEGIGNEINEENINNLRVIHTTEVIYSRDEFVTTGQVKVEIIKSHFYKLVPLFAGKLEDSGVYLVKY
jgi:predicted methyltransferase